MREWESEELKVSMSERGNCESKQNTVNAKHRTVNKSETKSNKAFNQERERIRLSEENKMLLNQLNQLKVYFPK